VTEYMVGGRRTGRTTELLKWMSENPGSIMICVNEEMATKAFRQAKLLALDLSREQFTSFRSKKAAMPRLGSKVCIDNVDYVLDYLFGKVEKVTTDGQARLLTFDHGYQYREKSA